MKGWRKPSRKGGS